MPDVNDPNLSAPERKLLSNVGEYGWHCLHVSDADNPVYWTYSIGVYKNRRVPEIVIFGLPDETAHAILSGFVQDIESGDSFEANHRYEVFERGYQGMFLNVDARWHSAFLSLGQWFYDYEEFPVFQCVWPDKDGRLPWETGFNTELPPQPMLISEADAERLGYSLDGTLRAAD